MLGSSRVAIAAAVLSLVACSVDVATQPPSPGEVAPPSTSTAPAPDGTVEPVVEPPLARTEAPRALRGAWISSVWNGTWPSRSGLSAAAAEQELVVLLDAMAAAHMNAAFLQVRPESDALYPSTLEPFSRFLTGTQGGDPGYDPLALALRLAHARGIELHAWINPFRGMTSASVTVAASHVTRRFPSAAKRWGNQVWMDPGSSDVKAHALSVIEDLLARYDIDGIHFDDYFYPYPVSGQAFPDDDSFAAYTSSGGSLSKDDWRRANVDGFVRDAGALVRSKRPDVRFGVSPFGIWRPGHPAGVQGLDAYATLYCDAPRWIAEGWVDYVAPQLYWPTTQTAQAFGKLLDWWAGKATPERPILAGHDLTKIGEGAYTPAEYDAQLDLVRGGSASGRVAGSILFTAKPIATNASGARTRVLARAWPSPRLTPKMPGVTRAPAAPVVTKDGDAFVVSAPSGERARAVVLYEPVDGGFRVAKVIPEAQLPARLLRDAPSRARGELGRDGVVSLVDRFGAESAGVHVR